MADLDPNGLHVEKKLTIEERLDVAQKDIRELSRGVNAQASLLESIIIAFDNILKKYLELTKVKVPPHDATPKE